MFNIDVEVELLIEGIKEGTIEKNELQIICFNTPEQAMNFKIAFESLYNSQAGGINAIPTIKIQGTAVVIEISSDVSNTSVDPAA